MRHIDKTKTTQPDFLLRFRKQNETPVNYGEMRKLENDNGEKYCKCQGTKQERDIGAFEMQLLKEQGFLCAYCNDKIPEYKKVNNQKYCKAKVEHWHPESSVFSIENKLDTDYRNMIICCMGRKAVSKSTEEVEDYGMNKKELHCDTSKKELFMTLDPREKKHINKLKYTENGQIYCIDFEDRKTLKAQYNTIKDKKATLMKYKNGKTGYFLEAKNLTDEELNLAIQHDLEFILNLNTGKLKNDRQTKWNNINSEVSNKFRQPYLLSQQKRQFLNSKISFFDNLDDKGEYEPMCMVKIFYLKQRMKRLNKE